MGESSHYVFGLWSRNIMWFHFILLLLVGAAVHGQDHAWKKGQEYHYLVRSRTLTGPDEVSPQYSGVLMKGLLTLQAKTPDLLQGTISMPQYARLHKNLPEGWDSWISDGELQLREIPLSGKTFEIKLKHGLIRDVLVDRDVPTWELNLLKGIVSQLQVDTEGENRIRGKDIQVPDGTLPYAMFTAMEDSVGGKCEVLYDVTPLSELARRMRPELVPMPDLRGDGYHINIMKTKNYSRCDQRVGLHLSALNSGSLMDNSDFISKSTTSRIVISGTLKRFTIQSSVSTNKIFVRPRLRDSKNGVVYSKVNLTLVKLEEIGKPLQPSNNLESTGNLVYLYNDAFYGFEGRTPRRPSVSRDSLPESSENVNENKRQSREDSSLSEDDLDFLQPKPKLGEPLRHPLLPLLVGHLGKNVLTSEKSDPETVVNDLLTQITEELENPNEMPTRQTLEKFTILASVVRTLSAEQLVKLENSQLLLNRWSNNEQETTEKGTVWDVFRDVVVQAGTGPALLTLIRWYKEKKLENTEAVVAFSRLTRTVRAPTDEYFNTLFEFTVDQKQQPLLKETLPLVLGELIRNTYVSGSSNKDNRKVKDLYIPFMATQLEEAVKEVNGPRILTYIRALGLSGHPKILSVFEPYLEGKRPITTFQRMTMVTSLSKLANTKPDLAGRVLYKIYLNAMENHEVRCAAVYLLMKTDPPLLILMRMASSTNSENKHVNSAIKSSIKNAAEYKLPQYQGLAIKARIARKLLSRKSYDYKYSKSYIKDTVFPSEDFAYRTILNTVGSDGTNVPKALYYSLTKYFNGLKWSPVEMQYATSDIKQLLNKINRYTSSDEKTPTKWLSKAKNVVENVARKLNVLSEDPQQLEGSAYLDTMYSINHYYFDDNTLDRTLEELRTYLKSLRKGRIININKMASYDITVSFPTETGLPLIYSLKQATLTRVTGKQQLEINTDNRPTKGKLSTRLVLANKVLSKIAFITPFEQHRYGSGIDFNTQVYLPTELEFEWEPVKKNLQVELRPLLDSTDTRLIHYSVVPYTTSQDILDLRPVTLSKNTYLLRTNTPRKVTVPLTKLYLEIESDNLECDIAEKTDFTRYYELLVKSVTRCETHYTKLDLYLRLDKKENNQISVSATYDSKDIETSTARTSVLTNVETEKTEGKRLFETVDKLPNSKSRRDRFLRAVSKGLTSGTARVLDVSLDVPGKKTEILTLGLANERVENTRVGKKSQLLLYWNFLLPTSEKINMEVCAVGQMRSLDDNLLDFEKMQELTPKKKFKLELQFGSNCAKGEKITITGNQTQTDNLRNTLMDSEVVKKCQQEMREGNKWLLACRKATTLATTEDQLEVSVNMESDLLNMFANKVVHHLSTNMVPDSSVTVLNPVNAGTNVVDVKVNVSPDLEQADLTVHTSEMDVQLPSVKLSTLSETSKYTDKLEVLLEEENKEAVCTLDNNRVLTFDDKLYPLKLGKCWHVVVTTYPQQNPKNLDEVLPMREERRVALMIYGKDDGTRLIRLLLGDTEIKLEKLDGQLEATVNGEIIELGPNKVYRQKEEDKIIFEIIESTDGLLMVVSSVYDVRLVYDGKRIQLEMSDEYRNAVRGLCGNFDANSENDFLTPKRCLLEKPEEFVATYALVDDNCSGQVLENRRTAVQTKCVKVSHHQSDVVSDVEAGRPSTEGKRWGYHQDGSETQERRCYTHRTKVVEKNDAVCFTSRPMLVCSENCVAVEEKLKKYPLYCMPKNEAALQLKKRVEQGANPDMSQRPVSMSVTFTVPMACTAA